MPVFLLISVSPALLTAGIALTALLAALGTALLLGRRLARRESPEAMLFRKFFESGLIGNAISAFDKKWLQVNDSLCRMLGYTRAEMLAMTWAEMTHPADLELDVSNFEEMLSGRTDGYAIDKRFIRKDGSTIPIHLSVSCIRQEGRITHILASVLDMTNWHEAREQIRELSRALLRSQEEERQRISRDLHDSFAQELSLLKLGMQSLFHDAGELTPATRAQLLDMMEILQHSIQGIRDLSGALAPQGLMQLGLSRTLKSYCEHFTTANGVPVHFSSAGLGRNTLPDEVQINCFRIVQEALSNALRHARIPEGFSIWVKLAISHPDFILRIEDNGRGFNPETLEQPSYNNRKHSMGLRNIQERTRLLGGTLRIQSEPEQGTKIVIRIPLPEETAP